MEDIKLDGLQFMGENLRDKVKYCGEGVKFYPLCKMIHPSTAELDDHCQIMDYAFIDSGESLKLGKYSTVTWHCIIKGGAKTIIGDRDFGFYNVGNGYGIFLLDQIKGIIEVFDDKKTSKILFSLEMRNAPQYVMCIDEAKDDLGYEPEYSHLEMLQDMKKERELGRF